MQALCAEQPPRMRAPELRSILDRGLPGVGERECPGVEHVGRPAPSGVCPVVGSRLDETHRSVGILAQPRGEHATRRAAADDDRVERTQHAQTIAHADEFRVRSTSSLTGGAEMTLGLTRLARLLLVALTLLAATAGAARANGGGDAEAPLQLKFLGQQIFPTSTQFQGTAFGGLSGFAYDHRRHVYYALSDDQVNVRFYTLRIGVSTAGPAVEILAVTTLRDASGQPFAAMSLDPEGLALTSRDTLAITSEGFAARLIDPWVREFGLDGRERGAFPVPSAFLPVADGSRGVRQNLGFESAGVTPSGRYLFTGAEARGRAGRAARHVGRRQPGPPAPLRPREQGARPPVRLPDRCDRRAARACEPVRGQRARRDRALRQGLAAHDGALLLRRRARVPGTRSGSIRPSSAGRRTSTASTASRRCSGASGRPRRRSCSI